MPKRIKPSRTTKGVKKRQFRAPGESLKEKRKKIPKSFKNLREKFPNSDSNISKPLAEQELEKAGSLSKDAPEVEVEVELLKQLAEAAEAAEAIDPVSSDSETESIDYEDSAAQPSLAESVAESVAGKADGWESDGAVTLDGLGSEDEDLDSNRSSPGLSNSEKAAKQKLEGLASSSKKDRFWTIPLQRLKKIKSSMQTSEAEAEAEAEAGVDSEGNANQDDLNVNFERSKRPREEQITERPEIKVREGTRVPDAKRFQQKPPGPPAQIVLHNNDAVINRPVLEAESLQSLSSEVVTNSFIALEIAESLLELSRKVADEGQRKALSEEATAEEQKAVKALTKQDLNFLHNDDAVKGEGTEDAEKRFLGNEKLKAKKAAKQKLVELASSSNKDRFWTILLQRLKKIKSSMQTSEAEAEAEAKALAAAIEELEEIALAESVSSEHDEVTNPTELDSNYDGGLESDGEGIYGDSDSQLSDSDSVAGDGSSGFRKDESTGAGNQEEIEAHLKRVFASKEAYMKILRNEENREQKKGIEAAVTVVNSTSNDGQTAEAVQRRINSAQNLEGTITATMDELEHPKWTEQQKILILNTLKEKLKAGDSTENDFEEGIKTSILETLKGELKASGIEAYTIELNLRRAQLEAKYPQIQQKFDKLGCSKVEWLQRVSDYCKFENIENTEGKQPELTFPLEAIVTTFQDETDFEAIGKLNGLWDDKGFQELLNEQTKKGFKRLVEGLNYVKENTILSGGNIATDALKAYKLKILFNHKLHYEK